MGGKRQQVVGSMDPAHITTQRSPVAGPGIGVQAVEIAGPSANPTEKEAAPLTLQKHTERRTLYNTSLAQTTKKGGKRDGEELEAAMSDLINAQSRGLKCSRVPATLYFSNDKTSSYGLLSRH
jgi:hypothetical protein